MKEKMLMFAKVWLMSFVHNAINVFSFSTTLVFDIYRQNKIIKCLTFLT